MFYTYVLYSEKTQKHYYGSTKNVEYRLTEHNKGKVKFTNPHRPWKLLYFEEYRTRSEAYRRELFFKSIDGRNWLKSNKIIWSRQ
jgi:putative endonuclease